MNHTENVKDCQLHVLLKQRGIQRNTDFIRRTMLLCFIVMYLKYGLVFFIGINLIFIYKCCLIIRWYDS